LTEQIVDLVLAESSNSVSANVDMSDDEKRSSFVSAQADPILLLMKETLDAILNKIFYRGYLN
jgi:hypothetical protein